MSENMKDVNGYDIKPNSIKLFVNNRKEKDNQPDYTGKMFDEDGEEYYVSCWTNITKKGVEYLSGNFIKASEAKEKFGKEKAQGGKSLSHESTITESGDVKLDDDLPF